MINLLPPDVKKQYRAARMNVIISRYNVMLLCATVFLALAIGVAQVYLKTASDAADQTIADNANKAQAYASTKLEADAFRSQLSDAKTTMDGQISYSKALLAIAAAMPSGASLKALQLNDKSFGIPIKLTFTVDDEATARALLQDLEASPAISGVTRGNVSLQTGSDKFDLDVTMTLTKELAQ